MKTNVYFYDSLGAVEQKAPTVCAVTAQDADRVSFVEESIGRECGLGRAGPRSAGARIRERPAQASSRRAHPQPPQFAT